MVKNPVPVQETQEMRVQSQGLEDLLEEEMATHSSILTRKIPWTEEPGELQPMGLQRVGPWTARRSNQSILKEISPGISLEGMMLKLKLQYFGHLM